MSLIEHFAICRRCGRLKDFYVEAFGMKVAIDNKRGVASPATS
ncbi:MAG: hypothetical protein U0794_05930 [Isosphaeraceae bacterium]